MHDQPVHDILEYSEISVAIDDNGMILCGVDFSQAFVTLTSTVRVAPERFKPGQLCRFVAQFRHNYNNPSLPQLVTFGVYRAVLRRYKEVYDMAHRIARRPCMTHPRLFVFALSDWFYEKCMSNEKIDRNEIFAALALFLKCLECWYVIYRVKE